MTREQRQRKHLDIIRSMMLQAQRIGDKAAVRKWADRMNKIRMGY